MANDPARFDLRNLPDLIDKVEFKGTVVGGDIAVVKAMVDDAGAVATSGAVYFYDTKALALFDQAVILRARILSDDRESTVKLRPAATAVAKAASAAGAKVELDIAGEKQSLSAKLDRDCDPGQIEAAAPGTVPTLFSDEQRALIALHAPGAPALEVLRVLGPIAATRWTIPESAEFAYDLAVEEWSVNDDMTFIELSIKVKRGKAKAAHEDFAKLLADRRLQTTNEQKTSQVLKTLAAAV